MGLFKPVRKPVIRQTTQAEAGSAQRPRYVPKPAPCAVDCPIGCDVRGMLTTIAEVEDGNALEQAWQRITARNPFPSVCGRICPHPCETNCHRSLKEGPVAVAAVERFVGDYAIEHNLRFTRAKELPETVAVTSAGPAGLTAAYHLARRGYKVTISGDPGGMMRSLVPDEILDAEIQRILDLAGAGDAPVTRVVDTAPLECEDVARSIAAGFRAVQPETARDTAAILKERLRPEWYQAQPRAEEVNAATVLAEARRCMACGMCMGCGNCWSYCTREGFVKVGSGKRFKLNLERCNGCGKCADGCPSGYIDLS
jgi:Pyruvate/2-oxoacid:ferredoxin oxidoreductase delta subunit